VIISGSGNTRIAGRVASQTIQISGSGTYLGENLDSQTARVDLSSSGNAGVKVSQTLEASISGTGSITYIGDPVVRSQISSSGQITKRIASN
jgi:hypothetical protein